MSAETIYVLGEGGGVHAMDLPLPEPIEQRMRKGLLRRVNPDGSPYVEAEDVPRVEVPSLPTERPADSALKGVWVGWAVAQGADPEDAEAMTKQDLIDKYGGAPAE